MSASRRAGIVGTGLIGGSIGLALRANGWHVSGVDHDAVTAEAALDLGALDVVGVDPDAAITFVATPVGSAPDAVSDALARTTGVVTDVGSVKGPICAQIRDRRFIGGHPMAGSEQVGVSGADADLFTGAVWVLTPDEDTPEETYLAVRSAIAELGADVIALAPDRHDQLVAVVSHVPHLTAATLMGLADERAQDHQVLLRLAAGGFRDMTRIASGHPGIWPDICVENRDAIVSVLDDLIVDLRDVRAAVMNEDRDGLWTRLERARAARTKLPTAGREPEAMALVRIPIPDRPGQVNEITLLATEIGLNIADMEIAHSAEGERGVLILLIEQAGAAEFVDRLADRGVRASVRPLE